MKNDLVTGGALWNSNQPQVSYEEAWDPYNPPKGWVCIGLNESYANYECDLGNGMIIHKTENLTSEKMIEDNQRRFNESEGKRWGDGQEAGRMPLDLYFKLGLDKANKQRDLKYQRKIWNDPDYRKFRTFKGTI